MRGSVKWVWARCESSHATGPRAFRSQALLWSGLRRMVNGLALGLGRWSGLKLRPKVNGLGLGLGLWCGLTRRLIFNGLGLGLALWSGFRLRVMVWA